MNSTFEYLGHNFEHFPPAGWISKFKCSKCGSIILKSADGNWKYSAANKIDNNLNLTRNDNILTCEQTIIKIIIE